MEIHRMRVSLFCYIAECSAYNIVVLNNDDDQIPKPLPPKQQEHTKTTLKNKHNENENVTEVDSNGKAATQEQPTLKPGVTMEERYFRIRPNPARNIGTPRPTEHNAPTFMTYDKHEGRHFQQSTHRRKANATSMETSARNNGNGRATGRQTVSFASQTADIALKDAQQRAFIH
jgi:hypothetical protein